MNREVFEFDVHEELRKIRTNIDQAKISTISRISSNAVNPYLSENNKVEEVKNLIGNCARYWGETEENIDEYIKDQLATFSLDDLINCFRSLNEDIQTLQPSSANVAKVANLNEEY